MQQLSGAVNKIISTGHYQITTPKNPDAEDKPFPVPGPMPVANVQVEPPMQPSSLKMFAQKPKAEGAFVQAFDEKSEEAQNDEENDELKEEVTTTTEVTTQKPTTTESTTVPTTKPTISPKPQQHIESKRNKPKEKKNEIVLNGQRFKLVAIEPSAEVSAETPASKSSEEEGKKKAEHEDQLLPMVILNLLILILKLLEHPP
jgi:hypothetical protein